MREVQAACALKTPINVHKPMIVVVCRGYVNFLALQDLVLTIGHAQPHSPQSLRVSNSLISCVTSKDLPVGIRSYRRLKVHCA